MEVTMTSPTGTTLPIPIKEPTYPEKTEPKKGSKNHNPKTKGVAKNTLKSEPSFPRSPIVKRTTQEQAQNNELLQIINDEYFKQHGVKAEEGALAKWLGEALTAKPNTYIAEAPEKRKPILAAHVLQSIAPGKKCESLYDELKLVISSIQRDIGNISADLKSHADSENKIKDIESLKQLYSDVLIKIQDSFSKLNALKPSFDEYTAKLQSKILKESELDFEMSAVQQQTIAYVFKPIKKQEVEQSIIIAKIKYTQRLKMLEELYVTKNTVENDLYTAVNTLYAKTREFGDSEFSKELKKLLGELKSKMIDVNSMQINSIKESLFKNTLKQMNTETGDFASRTRAKRLEYQDKAPENAEMIIHYKTIKETYLDLLNRTGECYLLLLEAQKKLNVEVSNWESDPRITDYNLKRFAIIQHTTESDLKKTHLEPYINEHENRNKELGILNVSIKLIEENYNKAHQEVNRIYDYMQRGGSFITEIRYNAAGYADPEVINLKGFATKLAEEKKAAAQALVAKLLEQNTAETQTAQNPADKAEPQKELEAAKP